MKVSVRVGDEWLQVPCQDGKKPIQWLGEEATRRYCRISNPALPANQDFPEIAAIRRQTGNSLLDFNDNICDVLDDNDFVIVHHVGATRNGIDDEIDDDKVINLDGEKLTPADLFALSTGDYKIKLKKIAEERVIAARDIVETILSESRVVYGITTGFGKFARTVISKDKLEELQENLIRSHAAGVGEPLTPARTRMLLALRINVLAKGHSGISLQTLKQLVQAFNASCLSWVPEQGTVGASGDLAPLSHLALGMMGEGKMWSPTTGWADAAEVLKKHGLRPIKPQAKEGLALINGTQLMTALGAEAVERAKRIARQADVVAAMTLEVLKGTSRAFDLEVHMLRPHPGQNKVARRLRGLLHSDAYPSEIAESHRFCDRVQDAYTLRCTPQVHGVAHDTIKFVSQIISTEMNSATDNPIVLPSRGEIISAGHFHGEYPAKALDYLAIGVHELASMSERRVERLVNPALSELPAFLVKEGGLNSGFMLAHCTAAALVSENKVLCHPSSVDSLSTSAGTEDHVSMGGFAARKILKILDNVERVIAIELLAACQAMEFLRPLKTTQPLEAVYQLVRDIVPAWERDRYMSPDIEAVTNLLKEDRVWLAVKGFMQVVKKIPTISRPDSPTATALHGPMPPSMVVENTLLFSNQESDAESDDGPSSKRHCGGHEEERDSL